MAGCTGAGGGGGWWGGEVEAKDEEKDEGEGEGEVGRVGADGRAGFEPRAEAGGRWMDCGFDPEP